MNDLTKACELLKRGTYTCVVCRGDTVFTTELRGVAPLLGWLDSGADLVGASAADKVIGQGAAFLYSLLGVKAVYGQTISRAALDTLRAQGIEAHFDTLAEAIINRKGTGLCPIEAAVRGMTDPQEALQAIRNRLQEMRKES